MGIVQLNRVKTWTSFLLIKCKYFSLVTGAFLFNWSRVSFSVSISGVRCNVTYHLAFLSPEIGHRDILESFFSGITGASGSPNSLFNCFEPQYNCERILISSDDLSWIFLRMKSFITVLLEFTALPVTSIGEVKLKRNKWNLNRKG